MCGSADVVRAGPALSPPTAEARAMKYAIAEELPTVVGKATPRVARGPEEMLGQLLQDLKDRAAAGARPDADVYLRRFPKLLRRPDLALRLLAEEFALRQARGEPDVAADLVR